MLFVEVFIIMMTIKNNNIIIMYSIRERLLAEKLVFAVFCLFFAHPTPQSQYVSK